MVLIINSDFVPSNGQEMEECSTVVRSTYISTQNAEVCLCFVQKCCVLLRNPAVSQASYDVFLTWSPKLRGRRVTLRHGTGAGLMWTTNGLETTLCTAASIFGAVAMKSCKKIPFLASKCLLLLSTKSIIAKRIIMKFRICVCFANICLKLPIWLK
jgi:hypothetical protein